MQVRSHDTWLDLGMGASGAVTPRGWGKLWRDRMQREDVAHGQVRGSRGQEAKKMGTFRGWVGEGVQTGF